MSLSKKITEDLHPLPDLSLFQDRLSELQCGVLVVGHGTRKPAGQNEFLRLATQLSELLAAPPVEPAFLELATPSIADGVKRLAEQGCKRIVVLPVLLFSAGHAKSDIPDEAKRAAIEFGLHYLGSGAPLETHPGAIELSERRFSEALNAVNEDIDVLPPEGSIEPRVGLAMVGRGTSDPEAIAKMLEFTRIRVQKTPVAWSETGFFAGGPQNVDGLLENARHSTADTIVVQPHLLFEGELMDQLRAKVQSLQMQSPKKRWVVSNPLGAEAELAYVFASILSASVQLPDAR